MSNLNIGNANFANHHLTMNGNAEKISDVDSLDSNDGFNFDFCYQAIKDFIKMIGNVIIGLYAALKKNTSDIRDIKNEENHVDEIIAETNMGDDKTRQVLPQDVIDCMHKHGILVDGMSIDDYIKKNGDKQGALNKGSLQAIKSALENTVERCTDISSEDQTSIQNEMQKRNNCIALLSAMISNNNDNNKSIIRNMS